MTSTHFQSAMYINRSVIHLGGCDINYKQQGQVLQAVGITSLIIT